MNITGLLSDEAILSELGQRLSSRRIERNMTQADLAKEAGVSKRTVENLENGASGQMSTLVRLLRVLELMDQLNALIPENQIKPMDLLKRKKKVRVRASRKKPVTEIKEENWRWKEDE